MFRSLQIAATGMVAQETKLDTIANNLANANTAGFKRQDADFEDLLYQTQRGVGRGPNGSASPALQLGSGARVVSTPRAFAQGPIEQTGNPLDVAIEGAGFLAVTRDDGMTGYTRAGSLKLDATGQLVTSDGLPIQPQMNLPADATAITVGSDGSVSATIAGQEKPTVVGKIQLTTFPNPAGLSAAGHNLYTATEASGEGSAGDAGTEGRGSLMQGAVEGSNVEVVTEMIDLVRTQRAYEINSKVIQAADEMLRNATQAH
jgi:flagellar basal-body rod protein FlgG